MPSLCLMDVPLAPDDGPQRPKRGLSSYRLQPGLITPACPQALSLAEFSRHICARQRCLHYVLCLLRSSSLSTFPEVPRVSNKSCEFVSCKFLKSWPCVVLPAGFVGCCFNSASGAAMAFWCSNLESVRLRVASPAKEFEFPLIASAGKLEKRYLSACTTRSKVVLH